MSSTKGIGRLSPCMLPSRPTDFLRISQIAFTSVSPRATRKAATTARLAGLDSSASVIR